MAPLKVYTANGNYDKSIKAKMVANSLYLESIARDPTRLDFDTEEEAADLPDVLLDPTSEEQQPLRLEL